MPAMASIERRSGPLNVSHQGQLPAVTLSFNLPVGVALGGRFELPNGLREWQLDRLDLEQQMAAGPQGARHPAEQDVPHRLEARDGRQELLGDLVVLLVRLLGLVQALAEALRGLRHAQLLGVIAHRPERRDPIMERQLAVGDDA